MFATEKESRQPTMIHDRQTNLVYEKSISARLIHYCIRRGTINIIFSSPYTLYNSSRTYDEIIFQGSSIFIKNEKDSTTFR